MLTGAIVDIGEQARERQTAVPKRQYSLEYKLQVVRETHEPGASVSIVARRHDTNTNIVFRWRKLFREGRLGGGQRPVNKPLPAPEFVPIHVMPDAPAIRALPAAEKPGLRRAEAATAVQADDKSVQAARAAKLGRTPV